MPKKVKKKQPVKRVAFLTYFEKPVYDALRRDAYKAHVSMSSIVQACVAECLEVKL